jgi:dephospho-CoA kinase
MNVACVALTGRIGTGKSTVARELSSLLGWPEASFGDYVRARASERGLDTERGVLQELGQQLIEERGFDGFVEDVLADAGINPAAQPFVIEGVRHVAVLEALQRAAGAEVALVYLEASDEARAERLRAREGAHAPVETWEQHETERDVKAELPTRADLVLHEGDPVAAAEAIARFLDERTHQAGA